MEKRKHYEGLNDQQVVESRAKYGVNLLTPPKKDSLWKQFLEKFSDPLIVILIIAGILSIGIACYEYFGLGEGLTVFFEPAGIFVAILLATGLAFYFELKANKAFNLLNKVNNDEPVKVIRNSNVTVVPKKDIVVGDIVLLSTGDEVPADGELLESITLHMDESTLTGEPVCSKTTIESEFDSEATYPSNYVLRGTRVMEGHGVYRVDKVGDSTENGKLFAKMTGSDIDEKLEEYDEIKEERELTEEENKEYIKLLAAQQGVRKGVKTPLNEQLDGLSELITNLSYGFATLIIVGRIAHYFSWNLLACCLIIPTALFFYLVIKKFEDWSKTACVSTIITFAVIFIGAVLGLHEYLLPEAELSGLLAHTLDTLMIAVTLIVVAVPEGLPMAVTLSLAYSMRSMLKTNNLVRKMHACETMGAITVICTDKTGTLTQNKMQVYETKFYNLDKQQLKEDEASKLIAEGIAVNSTASLDLSGTEPNVVGNPTEGALLLWLHKQGIDHVTLKESANTLSEIPFSTERKYMATVVTSSVNGKKILYVKGAPEIVYRMCNSSSANVSKSEVDNQLQAYQKKAMRTLGFAYQILDDNDKYIESGKVVATGLNFLGIVAISVPIRTDVPAAVTECMKAGIKVKIVTGDTTGTAIEIGRQIGLWSNTDSDKHIITGPEFAKLSDSELDDIVLDLKIIARARPMDKQRLVESLQRKNQVVSVTGDGTNDAPALKAAHVGLSMGAGTSVAKEASDITIIDNSFSSIGRAVMWGRSLYQNIQRFLLFQLTVNVAACFIVLVGAFMGAESPLTVTQMLWVNLIMDTFGAMALASLPPSAEVMNDKPRERQAFIINKPMAFDIVGVGGFFFLLTLLFVYIFQHSDVTSLMDLLTLQLGEANSVTPYEQTLIFSIFVWTHFWYMFNTRSFETGKSLFKLKLSSGFKTIVGVIVIGQIIIVEVFYEFFNVEPMFHTLNWTLNVSGIIDWLIIVVLSSLVLWVRELWHLLSAKKN